MFAHQKLHVYQKAVRFAGAASALAINWGRSHAVSDHLSRASESIVYNLAEGVRLNSAAGGLRALDCSIGSTLECAACLDIAVIKKLVDAVASEREKGLLCEIVKMLIGLRKSWETWTLQDDPPTAEAAGGRFHHEDLQVYAAALDLARWTFS